MKGHKKGIRGLVLSKDNSLLYTLSADGSVGIWRTKERSLLIKYKGSKAVFAGKLNSDETRLVTQSRVGDNNMRVWNTPLANNIIDLQRSELKLNLTAAEQTYYR